VQTGNMSGTQDVHVQHLWVDIF